MKNFSSIIKKMIFIIQDIQIVAIFVLCSVLSSIIISFKCDKNKIKGNQWIKKKHTLNIEKNKSLNINVVSIVSVIFSTQIYLSLDCFRLVLCFLT